MNGISNKNICLIGFMGTGKTSVGKWLANELIRTFVDTDNEIEINEGRTIPEIFSQNSESYFRDKESFVLNRLLASSKQVISTGGGIVLKEENRKLLAEQSVVIALTASIEVLTRRLQTDTNRPLLQGDLEQSIRLRLQERAGLYDFAHLTIDTSYKSISDIGMEILKYLEL